ncbi:MAG: Holliday junction resolvase RuvX [Chloroflexi bacterium]|nr:Holliday junction resolvase RuvX [Chloroflexota bacterium]
MSELGRLLGIDHGEKRIGVAVSDVLGVSARPLDIIHRGEAGADLRQIAQAAQAQDVTRIIVGLPTGTDGGVGMQGAMVIRWARKLAQQCDVPIVMWDESYSSRIAAQTQTDKGKAGGRKGKGRPAAIDDIAAAAILQDYLDTLAHQTMVRPGEHDYEPGQPLAAFSHIE